MDDDWDWAAPDTLLGQLERGRGLGLQRALLEPGADVLVVQCIEVDARWDRQLEERASYFTRLVSALRIPLDAIRVDLGDPELCSTVWFDVAVELARAGSAEASALLRRHLRQLDDTDAIGEVVGKLWADGGSLARVGLLDVVLERLTDDGLRDVVHGGADGPWVAWRHEPRVAAALTGWAPMTRPARPDLTGWGRQALLALAREPAARQERADAFRELARRGDEALLDVAERPEQRNSWGFVSNLTPAVLDLGPSALPRARTWLTSGDHALEHLAAKILAEHGEATDGPTLHGLFEAAVDHGDWLTTEPLAHALARTGYRPATPAINQAWATTLHSHARAAYLQALAALDPDGLRALRQEAADDCESEVRRLVPAH